MSAKRTIKESAEHKDPDFHSKIVYVDLIEKEFKYHRTCYRNFTRDYLSNCMNSSNSQEEDNHDGNKGDFEKVKRFISENILCGNEASSINILLDIYVIGANDTQYRMKLKKEIKAAFPDQLYFVTAKAVTPEIVLNANKVSGYVALTKESNILTAANIKKDILQYCSDKTKTKRAWRPTTEQFSTSESSSLPESVHLFLKELLKSEKHSVPRSENIARVVESCSRFSTWDQ